MIGGSPLCSVRCSVRFYVQMCPNKRKLRRNRLWEPFETRDLRGFREKNPVRGQRFKSSLPDQSYLSFSQSCRIKTRSAVKCWLFVMVRDEAPDARQKRSDHHRWRSGDPGMGIVGWQACHSRLLWRLRRSGGFKKTSQFRRCPELWDRIEFLERRSECVRQAPHVSGLELLVLRIEVELVHSSR